MSEEFEGIEFVDPVERAKQQALSKAVWSALVEKGFGQKCQGKIRGVFFSDSAEGLNKLAEHYVSEGWTARIELGSDDQHYCLEIETNEVYFTEAAFVELAEIFLIDASCFEVEFDGFHVESSSIKKKRWWNIWQ